MSAEELFKDGRLNEAITAQNAVVKGNPSDRDQRFLLFVLLCFAGELERAEKQLDVMSTQDDSMRTGDVTYRSLLASEMERRLVFEKGVRPVLPPDPPPNVDLRLEALRCLRQGEPESATQKIDAAVEATSAIPGALDGHAFDEVRDYDDVLGTVLEVFTGGRYLWMPMERVRRVTLSEPSTAIDTLWIPAQLEDTDGNEARVFLPALYAGSHASEDDSLRLGRETRWQERGELYLGEGQRILLTGAGGATQEHGLLQVRSLELHKAH